jgi:hypothetical protein
MNTARNFFGPTLEDARIWLGTNGNQNVRLYSLEYPMSTLGEFYAATPGYKRNESYTYFTISFSYIFQLLRILSISLLSSYCLTFGFPIKTRSALLIEK